MQRNEIVQELAFERELAVLSTGQNPETFKDLLIIGELSREDCLDRLAGCDIFRPLQPERCDDAILLHASNGRMGVAYYERGHYFQTIQLLSQGGIVNGDCRPWSIGPWLPETFASDLSRAHIISADNEVASTLQEFNPYPDALGEAISATCSQEISLKSELIKRQAAAESVSRAYLSADICLAGMRLSYARERIYFRGLRYNQQTLGDLSATGQRAVANLEAWTNYHLALGLIE